MSIGAGVKRLFYFQVALVLCISGILYIFVDTRAARSAFLAGVVSILPSVLFAWKLFYYRGARSAKKIVNSFYKGEALKLLFAVFLFSLVFRFFTINPLVFFMTFIAVQLTMWIAPLLVDKQKNRHNHE